MGERTKIQWCDATFNPWIGCSKISPGCQNCYALDLMETRYKRVQWGPTGTRVRTSDANWRKPVQWDRQAAADGVRRKVFCASLADVFEDRAELIPWREELFFLIGCTTNLDWLLLTKRPENVMEMLPTKWRNQMPDNIWLGTSVENQEQADKRIPHLLKVPARIRFLSMEPLLGPVDLSSWLLSKAERQRRQETAYWNFTRQTRAKPPSLADPAAYAPNVIRWIIVGGESGHNARPCHPDWVRLARDQCKESGVPFFFKQHGEWKPVAAQYGDDDLAFELDDDLGTRLLCLGNDGFIFSDGDFWCGFQPYTSSNPWFMAKVGKHAAGRLLDGQEWSEFPGE